MRILRFLTAGESHGPALTGILDGLPAGLPLRAAYIDEQLARRQKGHGRGNRMRIERDAAEILGGVRHGRTTGAPLALLIRNNDFKNWKRVMRTGPGGDERLRAVRVPRPGHADFQGAVKYGHRDMRDVLERASARETAMRVALGSAARLFLEALGVAVVSRVISIGSVQDPAAAEKLSWDALSEMTDASPVRCLGKSAGRRMAAAIDKARKARDTLGGVFEVRACGLPIGLGGFSQWDRRLEGCLARAFMSLNGVKGVEIGLGFGAARCPGSRVHDALYWSPTRSHVRRRTNRSGGIDGGMSTGQTLVLRAAMKPIATLMRPLPSVNLETREPAASHIERSDTCAVPAAAVIAESIAAFELADVFLQKLGGDSMEEILPRYESLRKG